MSTTTLQAVSAMTDLLQLAASAASAATQVSAMLAKAQAEGREISEEDWAALDVADAAARAHLIAAITKARSTPADAAGGAVT